MRKSDKKIENILIKALSTICEELKVKHHGFIWLTHFVDYASFPQSLKIVFVFDTNQNLLDAKSESLFKSVFEMTGSQLKKESIHIKRIENSTFFDTEENGADSNSAKWCRKYS